MVVSQQHVSHIAVRLGETRYQEFVFVACGDVVRGSADILFTATADVLCWSLFHRDPSVINFLLTKPNVNRLLA